MTQTMPLAATMPSWFPAHQARHDRAARRATLVVAARSGGEPSTPEPPRRRSLLPRLAGARGLL